MTFATGLTSSGGADKYGAGTLTLSASISNEYSGTTYIYGDTLQVTGGVGILQGYNWGFNGPASLATPPPRWL